MVRSRFAARISGRWGPRALSRSETVTCRELTNGINQRLLGVPDPMSVLRVNRPRGFTIVELLIVIAIISFIAALLLPALSGAKAKGKGADCLSRLKQIGTGFRLSGNDNEELFPWQIDMSRGGSAGSIDWTDNFRAISNELVTPKILACPSDNQRKQHEQWNTLDGNRHVSYFIGIDALESKPQTILAGDRNVYGTLGGYELMWNTFVDRASIDAKWMNTMHAYQGYVVLADGSVHHTFSPQLCEMISAALTSGGTTQVNFSLPRGAD